ncbi:chorismate-binding protein [Ampullimonas aquatilis]|uniref:chorismate-binding protein n=1 Tax=Ampullimonas aquatilis TaxID=1341549 RepID=UPI003C7921A4
MPEPIPLNFQQSEQVYALLDDCNASAAAPSSRLYTNYAGSLVCDHPARLDAVCAALAEQQAQGLHAVVLVDYEFGARLQGIRPSSMSGAEGAGRLQFLLFKNLQKLSAAAVTHWLDSQTQASPAGAGIGAPSSSMTEATFTNTVEQIQAALQAGESYQINFTYALQLQAYGSPLALYQRLRAVQPVAFGALIALPDGRHVLSCSPELFLRHQQGQLTTQPMKGTAARAQDEPANSATAQALQHDAKNRAENVMIVDLLRNDLGRIAQIGSVQVPALFTIEAHTTLFQMTSTVTAQLRPGLGFADVLRALFPCGSITGAPKHQSMQLINTLETTPRGLYTGTIGWLEASPAADSAANLALSSTTQPTSRQTLGCGNFCLSVAIRTLLLDAPNTAIAPDLRQGQLGIGGGIVMDSKAADEYRETLTKARFLTSLRADFELFETMRATATEGIHFRQRHLARLAQSAQALGFVFDAKAIEQALDTALQTIIPTITGTITQTITNTQQTYRLRLAINQAGAVQWRCVPLTALVAQLPAGSVKLLLAAQTLPRHYLLQHKTTRRSHYDSAIQQAEAQGAFDMLFCNEAGELTEGGRSNLLVKLNGQWCTPPLACGVLPGIMRGVLLEDANWPVREQVLTLADLQQAEALAVCNALRGVLPACLIV